MYVIQDLSQTSTLPAFQKGAGGYVTVGVFDGVHRGHQRLMLRMVDAARADDGVAVAVLFNPHPAIVLGGASPPLLTTLEERICMLAELGLDVVAPFAFTPDLARISAADFVEILLRHFNLVQLWGGPDLALGHRRAGNVAVLREVGAERGFGVRVVEPMAYQGGPVSSSRVRDALKAGDLAQANGCLGRPYRLTGTVVHGDGRGRTIGVPTANLSFPPQRLIPARGIYAGRAYVERLGARLAAVNVGLRPTFADRDFAVEAHLLDFEGNLYGEHMALDFIARLRDEETFPDVETLVAQMRRDIDQVRRLEVVQE